MVEIAENAFVTLICERGCSHTEYKNLSKREIVSSVNYECLFYLRGYLLIAGD